jgi:hypothetical protein
VLVLDPEEPALAEDRQHLAGEGAKSSGLPSRTLNPSAALSTNQRSISLATVVGEPTKGEREAAKRQAACRKVSFSWRAPRLMRSACPR